MFSTPYTLTPNLTESLTPDLAELLTLNHNTDGAISAKPENRCVVVTEAGSYLRLIDFCITQLKAQGPSRTCNESKEEEGRTTGPGRGPAFLIPALSLFITLGLEMSDTKVYEP